ncbi:hypothetical protein HanPI659440_Chr09g0353501 [Helianthus annuus]|nr:hypothetical protein HanPI659440_Chr09g0353501 [Helianthus annuus]
MGPKSTKCNPILFASQVRSNRNMKHKAGLSFSFSSTYRSWGYRI